jgi:small neutral amino acid transporter SnatA (MarC family)
VLRILGENGMLALARFMGLILAVIGAQMVLTRLTAAF